MRNIIILIVGLLTAPLVFSENQNDNVLLVSLERTACYGRCPIYSLSVFMDGKAVFKGERFTDFLGVKEFIISPESVEAIKAEINRVQFSKFSNEYSDGGWGCFMSATDNATLIMKATLKNKVKSISAYLGCENKKVKKLYEFSKLIDNIVGTEKFIKGSEK